MVTCEVWPAVHALAYGVVKALVNTLECVFHLLMLSNQFHGSLGIVVMWQGANLCTNGLLTICW